MPSTNSVTYYQFQIGLNDPTSPLESGGTLNFTSTEMTDAQAFAFLAALEALPMPAGVSLIASVEKQEQGSTSWTTDLTSTPPSFT